MKRFIKIGAVLLLLCAAAAASLKYADTGSGENKPDDGMQQVGDSTTSTPPEPARSTSKPSNAAPMGKPSTSSPAANKPPISTATTSNPPTSASTASNPPINASQTSKPATSASQTSHPATNASQSTEPSTDAAQAAKPAGNILLVNAAHPLPKDFRPANLVKLFDYKHRHFQLAKADIEIGKTVYEAMDKMFAAAQKDGVKGFIITSGYRSRKEQQELYAATADGTAAKPGISEHEAGLAFDVAAMGNEHFELTPQFKWLMKHCAAYGFILRYPKGKEDVTGYPYEPWHYRYVGKADAAVIMAKGITLEQYLEAQ